MDYHFFKGFRGLARITRKAGGYFIFRFTNADVGLSQDVNTFLPSYGGEGLYRIISPKVGDITGRMSLILGEGQAQTFYDIAKDIEEITLELMYRDGSSRKFTKAKLNQLSFSCKAGEMVQVNADLIAQTEEATAIDIKWKDPNKLVTWDKAGFDNVLTTEYGAQSFTYVIENNLVVNRTAKSLFPFDITSGIQKIGGEIVWLDRMYPEKETASSKKNAIKVTSSKFWIDNFSITHDIAQHWSYRTPLSSDLIVTTLEWTKVKDLGSV